MASASLRSNARADVELEPDRLAIVGVHVRSPSGGNRRNQQHPPAPFAIGARILHYRRGRAGIPYFDTNDSFWRLRHNNIGSWTWRTTFETNSLSSRSASSAIPPRPHACSFGRAHSRASRSDEASAGR